jgi:hypothetical protein
MKKWLDRLTSQPHCRVELVKEKRSVQPAMTAINKAGMAINTIVVFLASLVLASGCAAGSGSRYRPCNELRTDMSVSNEEFDRRCHRSGE